ncbi:hypothetical protein [Bosea sp. BIWAKO-01]|uniref:hypothetical protein n=1 Tax=Bosea sp. BIWAKO-01 TaxID=506668 RepID=UPI00086F8604|nr:hypothetical protein [Bosea sp. BIWAKO-01]GAU81443.1 hypothetical protein BIWAKO_01337 [Bosea sp. BIWAKO-01]
MALRSRKPKSPPPPPLRASRDELNIFLNGLQAAQAEAAGDSAKLRTTTLAYIAKYSLPELQGLLGRAYVDAPKSASQKLGTMPTGEGGAPSEEPPRAPSAKGQARPRPKSR